MNKATIGLVLCSSMLLLSGCKTLVTDKPESALALYQQNCAICHGDDRLGRIGPALLPENLGRLKQDEAVSTILDGRAATQMPAFQDKLTAEQVKALVEFIYVPPAQVPVWG